MKQKKTLCAFCLLGILLCSLAACGPSSSSLSASSMTKFDPVTRFQHTIAMPATQSNCPDSGTTRAMVTAPLALSTPHQAIVYVDNEANATASKPASGSLYRYDVATKTRTLIVRIPSVAIENAQVSRDGQWTLFLTMNGIQSDATSYMLDAVRLDGQGLQTLYCQSTPLSMVQWSPDRHNILLSGCQVPGSQQIQICLLDATNGNLQVEFTATSPLTSGVIPRMWLDNTHIYLSNLYANRLPDALYVLDTTKGPNQTYRDLIPVIQNGKRQRAAIADVDSSYDLTHIFVCYDNGGKVYQAPAQISEFPALKGDGQLIYSSPRYAIIQVRSVTPRDLLFIVSSLSMAGKAVDASHNGLWLVHKDGTGLARLTIDSVAQLSQFSHGSQYAWSNVSRDGKMYALEQQNPQKGKYALSFGSLDGGPQTVFASVGYELEIAGWTKNV
jgi:eukaryotic-like serine/threonine-protein kinase